MCGRFSLFDMLGVKVRFNIGQLDWLTPRYNIAPSQEVLAIINDEGYKAVQFKWGLIPFWAKDKKSGIINARAETVDQKPSFKNSFKSRRCLIPADGFYEWMKEESGKRPYRITLKSGEVFAFAGLWDTWTSPQGDKINSCTIITTSANTLLEPIHNRMPVILDREKEEVWLDPETDNETFKSILKPYPAELMKSYEVSTSVNSPREHLSKRSLVDNHLYFVRGGQGNLETKRGCSGSCIYCADPLARGKKQRLRPARHVVKEFQNLIEQGIDCFHLCDAEFNLPPSHAEEICRALIDSGVSKKISWYAYCSPEPFSRELASLMKKAGCAGINFGVDSASEEILSRLGRSHDQGSLKSMARYCHQNRLPFMVDLLIGGPGENRQTIAESIEFVKSMEPSAAGISLGVRLYQGTPLEQMLHSLEASDTCLHGRLPENENLLQPVYYLSPRVGEDIHQYLNELIGDDPRFFSLADPRADRDYSYTENQVLMEAIEKGYRGAYWHILQKLQQV